MKVTLMPGIESISGSVKQRNGNKLVFKTFRKPSASRGGKPETRAYLMTTKERTTPLSEKEINIRRRFHHATVACSQLSKEQWHAYADEFKSNKGEFNGKTYKSLRGYVFAKLIHEAK